MRHRPTLPTRWRGMKRSLRRSFRSFARPFRELRENRSVPSARLLRRAPYPSAFSITAKVGAA